MTHHDVIIVNAPKMLGHYFPAAPAVLKGCCHHLGVSSKIIDLNLDFLESCQKKNLDHEKQLVGITENVIPSTELSELVDALMNHWSENIASYSPKILAISVFSYYGQYFAKKLAKKIKSSMTNCKIVMGGSGIKLSLNSEPVFAKKLLEDQVIDFYVEDDGEMAWHNLLISELGLDVPSVQTQEDCVWLPNYDDFEITRYQKFLQHANQQIIVPITGSKGCVRKCDFCEIHQHWKFRQRPAESIVDEIKIILDKVKNPHINFTDSLVNGSLKEFDLMIDLLAHLKMSKEFSWSGQFIIRRQSEFNENRWKKLSISGVRKLDIGVETGSEDLRFRMKKHFTNQDLDFAVQMMDRHGITCTFLLITGHPLETDEDFEKTLSMMERYRQYQSTINTVQLGYAVAIQPGTPLYDRQKELGILLGKNPTIWMSSAVPELTYKKRVDRRIRARDFLLDLGYRLSFDDHTSVDEMQYNLDNFQMEIKIMERLFDSQNKKIDTNLD